MDEKFNLNYLISKGVNEYIDLIEDILNEAWIENENELFV